MQLVTGLAYHTLLVQGPRSPKIEDMFENMMNDLEKPVKTICNFTSYHRKTVQLALLDCACCKMDREIRNQANGFI